MSKIPQGIWPYPWLLLVALLLSSACSRPKAPEQLVFADPDNPIAALMYIAEAKGYFKDENLTVAIKKVSSGRESSNSVTAGESDLALGSEYIFANDILQGKDLRILATLQRTNQNNALVGRRDRGITSAADLAGKKIGLTPNTNSDYILSVLAREAGIADDAVTRVPLQPNQLVDALESGQVDAIFSWQPHVANAQARFPHDATVLLRPLSYSEITVIGVRAKTLVEKREALQRLVNALVRTEDFINTQRAEALQIAIAHLNLKPEVALEKSWAERVFHVRLDNLMLAALENEGAWLAGRINPSPAVPDYRAAFAAEFLQAARPQSVTVTKAGGN